MIGAEPRADGPRDLSSAKKAPPIPSRVEHNDDLSAFLELHRTSLLRIQEALLPLIAPRTQPTPLVGDLTAYRSARTRVVTAGLAPTSDDPSEGSAARWSQVLTGTADAFGDDVACRVHTFAMSPFTLVTPFGSLHLSDRLQIAEHCLPLWQAVVEWLRPDVIIAPIPDEHLRSVGWSVASTELRLQGEGSRTLRARWIETTPQHLSLLVGGCYRNGAFATLDADEQLTAGRRIAETVRLGPPVTEAVRRPIS